MPIDVVTTLFKCINSSGDGFVSHEEFTSYMAKPLGTISQETFKSLFFNIDVIWLNYLIIFVGGALFAVGGFATELCLVNHKANIFLGDMALYALTSFRNVVLFPINVYRKNKSCERAAEKLKISLKKDTSDASTVESLQLHQHEDSVDDVGDEMYNFIKVHIFAGREKLTRTDVEMAILKEMGPVGDSLGQAIVHSVDTDKNGTMDAKQIHDTL